jgi:hypothetical protein
MSTFKFEILKGNFYSRVINDWRMSLFVLVSVKIVVAVLRRGHFDNVASLKRRVLKM